MSAVRRKMWCGALACLGLHAAASVPMRSRETQEFKGIVVANGWHPWYEIKADPENPHNLIICGTKFDAQRDAPLGFAYVSSDGGTTWQGTLEDRSTSWVTEHSCAFGANHRAYFISEASKVIDGKLNHYLGTTRLYTSTDGGQHWRETTKTGWADFSSSAVSSASGNLYTFYNSVKTVELGRNWGANVGLLRFSPEGDTVTGPFFDPLIQKEGYLGIFPQDAVSLKSGAIVTLYWGLTQNSSGKEGHLGVIRADESSGPSLVHSPISSLQLSEDCQNYDQGSLTYDREHNRLFVAYVDGCADTRIMLTSSEDEGKTWTKSVSIADSRKRNRRVLNPSLVASSNGVLVLLWKDGSRGGPWLFSYIRDEKLVEPATVLSFPQEDNGVSNDSLWTVISQPDDGRSEDGRTPSESAITLSVRSNVNEVWKGRGLVAAGDRVVAVWSSGTEQGMRLYSGILGTTTVAPLAPLAEIIGERVDPDITRQAVMVYGGTQSFERTTGTLRVCLALENRGDEPIKVPIKLEATSIRSAIGDISVSNATNGLTAAGAVWDISDSVTGDRIPPRASSNPFCLSFHLDLSSKSVSPLKGTDLISLGLKVFADIDAVPERWKKSTTADPVRRPTK